MMRFLTRVVIFIGSAALGLFVTSLILGEDFRVELNGYLYAVLIFALAQSILTPFIFKMARKYASAFLGGVGLLSTFVALLLANWLTEGLTIVGIAAWVIGTLLVWLITALATWLLPMWLLKEKVRSRSSGE